MAIKLPKKVHKYTWQKLSEQIEATDGQEIFRFLLLVLGVLLIISSISLVYRVTKRLARAHTLTSVNVVKDVDINNPSRSNNFKLVHCSGKLSTTSEVKDEIFGPKANDCAKIVRIVEVC